MNQSPTLKAVTKIAAIVVFSAGFAISPAAWSWPHVETASWPSEYADEATSLRVEGSSIAAVEGLPGVLGAWFRYTHDGMSARCIATRACYAKAQLVYYRANCANGSLSRVQHIIFNLNGDIESRTEPDFAAGYYVPPFGIQEWHAMRDICANWLVLSLPLSMTAPSE